VSSSADEHQRGEAAHPVLGVQQAFTDADSYQIRDDLGELVARDLLGPWDGETEEFAPKAAGPLERYLVGMLGPKPAPKTTAEAADELPDTDSGGGGDGADPELPERPSPQNAGRMWASSMGLNFAVPADVDVVAVTARWGRYQKTSVLDEDGKQLRTWAREQVRHDKELRLDGEPSERIPLDVDDSGEYGVFLAVEVRPDPRGRGRVVELALVNAQQEPVANRDTAWLLQTELTVTALDGGSAVFLPIDDPLEDTAAPDGDPEERHLRLLYRNELRHAVGRNVAVHADVRAGERRAHRLTTTWLPTHDVPSTIAPPVEDSRYLAGLELGMDALAELPADQLATRIAPLAGGYSAWLGESEAAIPDLSESLRGTAEAAVFRAREIAQRLRAGIDLLTDSDRPYHGTALEAFRFANRAMALQRRHTAIGALRDAEGVGYTEAEKRISEKGPAAASWRPFQLAFILLNLPALTDPTHPERAADPQAVVDLLFFPTGGGKTEAYLGLAAYTFAVRRLQGTLGSGQDTRSGEAGVAVLMRYTLRLLTAQQFQRAAALVCAAEVLRREAMAAGDLRWGSSPFRIGMWVGRSVSPLWYTDAAEQVADAKEAGAGKRANVLQTLACPWCGTKLLAHRDLFTHHALRRVILYCPNGEGVDACPFSRLNAPDEGLPILTVDEEIYRLLPSLVIATVDKLAQLPWRGYAGMLFGRVHRRCPRHGYRHDDLDERIECKDRHRAKAGLPAVQTEPVIRLRPPDLIVQDELHLISGALGTVVGLFEAAVDELCTWNVPDGRGGAIEAGPKIVASTATTKRAREQVRRLYARQIAVFPPQVTDVADTFFSQQVAVTPATPGRRYLGVCAHGVRLKSAEIRIAEILLLAGQTLFDRHGAAADPYMTLVGYFNATRELAGMRRYLDDDVTTRVRINGHRKGMSDRIVFATGMLTVQELTSRISSGDIADVLKRLEYGFDPGLDTSVRRRAIAAELVAARREKRAPLIPDRDLTRMGVDVVLATSMLQVGVDVSRFGLMLVVGQPKNTAEYIQASSRVGRDAARPGLVVTLYNWSRPRDLAHFEDFGHYHATFYRQVEALSVTPYARRALDRATTSAFVAAVRNVVEQYSRNADAYDVDLHGPVVKRLTERFLARAYAADGERGRAYLAERIAVVKDAWDKRKEGSARLGYQQGTYRRQQLAGLLDPASGGGWGDLTVPQSMRETENEINLLLSGSDLFATAYGAPGWSFAPPETGAEDNGAADEMPEGDELGDPTPDPNGNG